MDVYIKLRKLENCVLLAVCDADMVGKTLKKGDVRFHIHEKFYKGSLVTIEEAIDLIDRSTIINIVGRKIVQETIARGLVHPDAVLEIEGVPHAQIVKL